MRFYEQENRVKNLIKINRKDEQIYETLRKLILAFLCKKKACNCYLDAEEVAHDLAVEMYQGISDGEECPNNIIGFLQAIYKSKVAKYYKNRKEVFEYDSTDQLDGIYNYTSEVFHDSINKIYLETIEKIIDESLRNCRYSKNSKVYNNLKLSIMLSLLNRDLRYFHLDEADKSYVQLLITDVKQRVLRDRVEYTEGGVYYEESITTES